MPSYPDTAYFTLVPDWVCEVLSRFTRGIDLTVKPDRYGTSGVRYFWFVDPEARTLEAFVHVDGAWRLFGAFADEAETRLAPFDAVAFSLSNLWPDDGAQA